MIEPVPTPEEVAAIDVAHAQAFRHQDHPHHRRRSHRHRPGLRVRLFRRAGLQGAEGRGLSGGAGELESGDHHDRPGWRTRCTSSRSTGRRSRRSSPRKNPDALLPTMGGQTALNCALDLADHGVLEKYGVEMIGASREAIRMAEDRELFRVAPWLEIGLECPKAEVARTFEQALESRPASVTRPSSVRASRSAAPAAASPTTARSSSRSSSAVSSCRRPRSAGRGVRARLEGIRDGSGPRHADNCIIVCSIENFDPMGVHTGDSITVAPAQTLTDKEYQRLRDAHRGAAQDRRRHRRLQRAVRRQRRTAAWSSSR
jgi:hypothetical protein